MGKFADFYVVPTAEINLAARSNGHPGRWPHYTIKRLDVYQVANLRDLLRGEESEHPSEAFEPRLEWDPPEASELSDSDGDLTDAEMETQSEVELDNLPSWFVSTFPADFVALLAALGDADRAALAERWQKHPDFFWSRCPGTAAEVVGELCRLATIAVQRRELLILAESGY